jgi:hypothetical protein
MSNTLATLITNAETSAHAVKAAADSFVVWLSNVRTDIEKCEADLAAKRRAADTEVHRLKMAIEERRKELAKVEHELAEVRKAIDIERREIGRERERLRNVIDHALA